MRPVVVVKVGGSLYDLPDLGSRLRKWLDALDTDRVILVPGGGATADVVRDLDRIHGLGEERAHWLALASLSLTGRFLSAIVPRTAFVTDFAEAAAVWERGEIAVLDPYSFALADEGRPGCLPHCWDATSDSFAARAAVVSGARRLVLLKSVLRPEGVDWGAASRLGMIDARLAEVVSAAAGLVVEWVNLRAE